MLGVAASELCDGLPERFCSVLTVTSLVFSWRAIDRLANMLDIKVRGYVPLAFPGLRSLVFLPIVEYGDTDLGASAASQTRRHGRTT